MFLTISAKTQNRITEHIHFVTGIDQEFCDPTTNNFSHDHLSNLFFKSVDFVITMFEVADLRFHRFDNRLNFSHAFILNGTIEIVFFFREVRCCPQT